MYVCWKFIDGFRLYSNFKCVCKFFSKTVTGHKTLNQACSNFTDIPKRQNLWIIPGSVAGGLIVIILVVLVVRCLYWPQIHLYFYMRCACCRKPLGDGKYNI